VRPACSSTRRIVPDNPNKFAAALPVPAPIPEFLLLILYSCVLRTRIIALFALRRNSKKSL
jgi:hypothetical protein